MSEENQELRACSRTHLGGDGNPKSVLLNDEQEAYALSLGFKGKESFARRWIVGEVSNNRNIVVGGISNISWSKLEAAMEEGAPRLNVPPALCLEPQLCHPISCGVPAARANSTPSSTSAVLNPAIEKWMCKQGYSVDGTRGGATYFEIQCGVGGDFLPLEQDCIDIDFCAGNPCGVHGHCYDCSTTGCGEE